MSWLEITLGLLSSGLAFVAANLMGATWSRLEAMQDQIDGLLGTVEADERAMDKQFRTLGRRVREVREALRSPCDYRRPLKDGYDVRYRDDDELRN